MHQFAIVVLVVAELGHAIPLARDVKIRVIMLPNQGRHTINKNVINNGVFMFMEGLDDN